MPAPTTIIGKICYAALCGILAFLIVLAIGYLIVHFLVSADAQSYGNTVKGLSVIIGLLVAGYVFFTGIGWPKRQV